MVNLASLQLTVIKWLIIILVFLLALVASNYAWWLSFLVVLLPLLLTLSILRGLLQLHQQYRTKPIRLVKHRTGFKSNNQTPNRFTPQALMAILLA